jgi:Sec-independent protein translocase protein TatA
VGKALSSFRKASSDLKNTINEEVRMEELKSIKDDIVPKGSDLVDSIYPPREEGEKPPETDGKEEGRKQE